MWTRLSTLGLALLWDALLGEPPAPVHPVVGMGKVIDAAARRAPGRDARRETARGAVLAAGLPLATYAASTVAMRLLRALGSVPAVVGGAFLLKASFAVTEMRDGGKRVARALDRRDIRGARHAVGEIVSRDVSTLDASGVASAAVGSIAENVTDSALGPLLAYGVLGVPGALTYRAVNTLDAMIGYRDRRPHFGRAAAQLDDAVNFVPARIAGAAVAVSSALAGMDGRGAWRTMLREHGRTESPNGGWPIGAAAGALGVEIEKVGHYRLGPPGVKPRTRDIDRALTLFTGAAAVGALLAAGVIAVQRYRLQRRRRRRRAVTLARRNSS